MTLYRVLAASLLILATPDLSAGEDCSTLDSPSHSAVVTALEGVSGALHCFKDVLHETLRDTRGSINDELKKLVMELKDDIRNWTSPDGCDLSKVQRLEKQLAVSQQEVEELKEKIKLLNNTMSPGTKSETDQCKLAKQQNIVEQVEEFKWHRSWRALRRGLEDALGHDTPARKQLQHIQHNENHPLWTIGRYGYGDLATVLVCGGLSPDSYDADGDTMLHGAARGGHARAAAALLDLGAYPDIRGSGGRIPLTWAAEYDHLDVVKLLTERGAALNATTNAGDTALHVAAREGNLVVVRYLVAAGADTTAPGKNGYTALDIARTKNNSAMIRFLSQFPQ